MRIVWLVFVGVFWAGMTVPAQASTLSDAASVLSVGAWVKLTPAQKGNLPSASTGLVTSFADSACWDPTNRRLTVSVTRPAGGT